MSAEYMAERLLDAVADMGPDELDDYADENVRTGGYFFEFTYRGRLYQLEITEMRQG